MPRFLEALWRHSRDRRAIPAFLLRFPLCTALALAPLMVGIPSQSQLVSVGYFIPMVFGVLGAVTLRENVQWLRPRNRLLWLARGLVTLALDLACLTGLILTLENSPERVGILAGSLLAMAAGMLVACAAQDFAWLATSLVGFVCLLAFDLAVVLYLPLDASVAVYAAALCFFSVRGPKAASAS